MKIAVNTRFLIPNRLEGIGRFTYEVVKRIVQAHPKHTFYFLFDRSYSEEFVMAANVYPVVVFPPARHPFLWYWWFEWSVANALKKIQPDIFISPDGFLSLNADTPTLLVIHDLAFEHYPQFVSPLVAWYYRYFTPRYCRKARRIITVSEASKRDIITFYGISPHRITVAYNGVSEIFRPLSISEMTSIRYHYTGGNNYFVYAGSLHPRKNIVNMLRAFEVFKDQTASDYKLVLAGARGWMLKDMDETLADMRYRNEIVFTGHVGGEVLAKIVGSAFALLYVSFFEGFGLPVAEAMRCGVPVITSNLSSMPEVAGNAALLVDPSDHHAIAQAMMQLYHDDQLRNSLIKKGMEHSATFSWDKTAALLWQAAEDVLNNR